MLKKIKRLSDAKWGALSLVVVLAAGSVVATDGKGDGRLNLIDFSLGSPTWASIDDVVMGGVSSSEMIVENEVAVFRGRLSLENNGGFASIRSYPKKYDLSGFGGLILRVRGDGKRYTFRLRTTADFDSVSYQVKLQPDAGIWHDVFLPFDQFEPVFRGRKIDGHPPLDISNIRTFGLMIADRQEGRFQIELQSVSAALEAP